MIYFLGWIFFAIVTAIVAYKKNRSTFAWLILGLIFSVLAFIVVLMLKTIKETKQKHIEINRDNKKFKSNNTYFYEIKPKKDVPSVDEWHRVKNALFDYLNVSYKIKQNDANIFLLQVSKSSYIKMSKIKKADESGSIKLFFKIESRQCGTLDFNDDIEVILSQKEGYEAITISAVDIVDASDKDLANEIDKTNEVDKTDMITFSTDLDSTEKLIKLSEMVEKGLLTKEEFIIQKTKII